MKLRVLIAEPEAEDLLFLENALAEVGEGRHWTQWLQVETQHAVTWQQAAAILSSVRIDAVLLNLDLPDSRGAETFRRAQAHAPHIPFILLASQDDRELAAQLVRDGAQDFLVKGEIDCGPLVHALENAIERQRLLSATRAAAMTDPLTGLLNRGGFQTFAGRDRMLAERLGLRLLVVAAEPAHVGRAESGSHTDGRKNSHSGRQNRDLALVEAADQLRSIAGPTSLIARLSETRFALALFDTSAEPLEAAWARLQGFGNEEGSSSRLTMGASIFDQKNAVALEVLLDQAEFDLAARALRKMAQPRMDDQNRIDDQKTTYQKSLAARS